MEKVLFIAQIIIAVFIIAGILIQNRGGGLSAVFGGSGSIYRTKRGLEKGLYYGTIIMIVLFVAIHVVNLAISS